MSNPREDVLDTRGSLCPQPIIDLARKIKAMPVASTLTVVSDDAAFPFDLRAWCDGTGHELLECRTEGRVHTGVVRKVHG